MRRIVEKVHHHGKRFIRHARRHHRKYLRGTAGFFGISKLFFGLITMIASMIGTYPSYATTTSLETFTTRAIPATITLNTIQPNISNTPLHQLSFDLSSLTDYIETIPSTLITIKFRIPLATISGDAQTIHDDYDIQTIQTLRTHQSTKPSEDTQNFQPLPLTLVYDQTSDTRTPDIQSNTTLLQTILYQKPAHITLRLPGNLNLATNNIFVEVDTIHTKSDTPISYQGEAYTSTTENTTDGESDGEYNLDGEYKELSGILEDFTIENSFSGESQNTTQQASCESFTTKDTCTSNPQCSRKKSHNLCINRQSKLIKNSVLTLPIETVSQSTHINEEIIIAQNPDTFKGYLKIKPQTLIKKTSGTFSETLKKSKKPSSETSEDPMFSNIFENNTLPPLITLEAPILVTDPALQGTSEKPGIPHYFDPIQTVQVGDPNNQIEILQGEPFEIQITITDPMITQGTLLHVFYSHDGTTRKRLNQTCIVDENKTCTFVSPHLTLFVVGTITRDNMEFLNEDFWNNNPTTGQIIDALFGTGGQPSAYTLHRSTGCRPTNIAYFSNQTLNSNTIYIVNASRILSQEIRFGGNCIGLVGYGGIFVKSGNFDIINLSGLQFIILDYLIFNNKNFGQESIEITNSQNITINKAISYNGTNKGIIITNSTGIGLYNNRIYNHNQEGMTINNSKHVIVHNNQIYNNGGYGIYLYGLSTNSGNYTTINNSQIYKNNSFGIYALYQNNLILHNTQINNNGNNGIYFSYSPNVKIHQSNIFKNGTTSTTQVNSFNSSGRYYGTNKTYPNPGFAGFSTGTYDSTLGRATGSLLTTDLGNSCERVTNPRNGETYLYTTSNCSDYGRTTTRTGYNMIRYLYGNNMLQNAFVPRQRQPVARGITLPLLGLSNLPFHGHYHIGDFYQAASNDINPPVVVFSGNTPPQGFNIANTGYFTIQAHIYEPNLRILRRKEEFPNTNKIYHLYDTGLVFMLNFDNIREIGPTQGDIKELSPYRHAGRTNNTTRTGNGRRYGAMTFPTTTSYMVFNVTGGASHPLNPDYISIFARVNPTNANTNKNIVSRYNSAYRFRLNGTGNTLRAYLVNSGGQICQTGTSRGIPANQRSFVGLVYDGENIYFLANTGQGWTQTIIPANTCLGTLRKNPNNVELVIGSFNRSSENFSGILDEIRIYNRPITDYETLDILYKSNLAARPNYRELTVNYTGIQNRQNGYYIYGFSWDNPVTDANTNTSIATGYVKKSYTCGTGFSFPWNNDNFLNTTFRNNNPTVCDILFALYGTGLTGQDPTAYTNQRSSRNNQCNHENMQVIYLTGGTDKIPFLLSGYTIYVLSGGNYLQTDIIKSKQTCSALIGRYPTPTLYTTITKSNNINFENTRYHILDNLIINGTQNGTNGTHTPNETIISIRDSTGATFNNLSILQGGNGVQINNMFDRIFGNNLTINQQANKGILISAKNTVLSGIQITNTYDGINYNGVTGATLQNTQIYNATGAGIFLANNNSYLTFNNLQLFNNGYGIQTLNDTNDANSKSYITLNNSQIYNNANDGLLLYRTIGFTINNSHIYNNSGNGLYFAGSNNNSGILNNVFIYNNGQYGVTLEQGNYTRYGLLGIFDNFGGNTYIINGSLSPGNSSTYAYLGRTGGTTTGGCMNCSRISNPRMPAPSYQFLIDTNAYPKCNRRGQDLTWTGTTELSYRYGISLTGQKLPVMRSGTTLTGALLPYNGSQYVAEINKLTPDYTDTQCSCLGRSYRRNNDNFLSSSFWNNNPTPTYCDILGALYGTAVNGTDRTAYTRYRTGRSGQCNIENTQVVYLTGGTNTLPTYLSQNTVYVLASGNYDIGNGAYEYIRMNTCTSIIGTTGSSNLYSLVQFAPRRGLIQIEKEFTIVDRVNIYGHMTSTGITHARNTHGIRYDRQYGDFFKNSTLNSIIAGYHLSGNIYVDNIAVTGDNPTYLQFNNITSYYSSGNGIHLSHTDNNYLNMITSFGNKGNGISIQGKSNILKNTISFNNQKAGISITESGAYNTLHNAQTFNNQNGIVISDNAKYNTINNIQSYNNSQVGVAFTSGANNNTLHHATIFNNSIGGVIFYGTSTATSNNIISNIDLINNGGLGQIISAFTTTGNIYYNTIRTRGSTNSYCRTTNMSTCITTVLDDPGILNQGNAFPILERTTGTLTTGTTISRDYMTNPYNITQTNYLLSWSGSRSSLLGNQPWNPLITNTIRFSYGSGIKLQTQPVQYTGTTLITGNISYNTSSYIGAILTTPNITGNILGITGIQYTTGLTVTGISSSVYINNYSLFGDLFQRRIGIAINTATGIFFTTPDGDKRIVMQIYGPLYFATHFQKITKLKTQPDCMTGRNNDNFLDQSFRNANPTSDHIICALFGSGPGDTTAYTLLRSGRTTTQCSGPQINVIYTGNIPNPRNLAANTIYVLVSGTYLRSSQINMASCSALISSGSTIIRKTAGINAIQASNIQHFIIDNITIDGNLQSNPGIYYISTNSIPTRNATINNVAIYRNAGIGIYYLLGYTSSGTIEHTSITNTKIYNNSSYGIFYYNYPTTTNIISTLQNNTINNSLIYNNQSNGIYYRNRITQTNTTGIMSNNTINNSIIFNNTSKGIGYQNETSTSTSRAYLTNHSINNSQIYHNIGEGIYTTNNISLGTGAMTGLTINNISFFNNGGITHIYFQNYGRLTPMKFYGTITHTGTIPLTNNTSFLITGSANDFPTLGRTTGTIFTSLPFSRDIVVNPINTNNQYLYLRTSPIGSQIGYRSSYNTSSPTSAYSYGSGIQTQVAPIYFSGTTLTNYAHFSGDLYIASTLKKITGDLIPWTSLTYGQTITITGISSSPLITRYNIFGDLLSPITNILINTPTSLTFTSGDENKTIITQLSGTSYFATHFQKTTTLKTIIDCLTGRNNDNFLDQSFRNANPTSENIICALFGSGPGDTTAYTLLRSGRTTTQCSGIQINVIYTGNIPNPRNLAANTIYVLVSGTYLRSSQINMASCSALISSGTTILEKNSYITPIVINNVYNTIIDNITIDGNSIYGDGIGYNYLSTGQVSNSTINKTNIYNNGNIGIFIYGGNVYNILINNCTLYNNNNGIHLFTYAGTGEKSTIENIIINNSKIYNNACVGIRYQNIVENGNAYGSITNTTINNSIITNNGCRANISYNNTVQENNSNTGIFDNNIINNSYIANNNGIMGGIYYKNEIILGTGSFTNTRLNNVYIINNTGQSAITITNNGTFSPITYYGKNIVTGNHQYITNRTPLLTTGQASDLPGLGWTNGQLITSVPISRDYMINPQSTSNQYVLFWTGTLQSQLGQISGYQTPTKNYSYGSGIQTEIAPIYFSGTTLTNYAHFSGDLYIASTLKKITGDLIGTLSGITSSTITLTGTAFGNPLITNYNLFGYITPQGGQYTIDTPTTITLRSGYQPNTIIMQAFGGNYNYFHFEKLASKRDCSIYTYTRNNDNFINSTFRATNPGDCEIIVALYGTGTNGQDTTAYTQHRSGRNGECNRNNMQVTYVSGGIQTLPEYLTAYTIYVLIDSGAYIIDKDQLSNTYGIKLGNCTTVIAKSSGTTFYSTKYLDYMFFGDTTGYTIIDNITINGNDDGQGNVRNENLRSSYSDVNRGGIGYTNSNNNTIHNVNFTQNTIGIECSSNNNSTNIYNNIFENNALGIYYNCQYGIISGNILTEQLSGANAGDQQGREGGILLSSANYNTLNNNTIFNNHGAFGILIENNSQFNLIKNTNIYNNIATSNNGAITIQGSSKNIFNNLQVYNNTTHGIYNNGTYNTFNNLQIYNNNQRGFWTTNYSCFVNNAFIYNNFEDGIVNTNGRLRINNINVFNNGGYGINNNGTQEITYYGNIYTFDNILGNTLGTIISGSGYSFRSPGVLYNDTLDTTRDFITNPKNLQSLYLLNRSGGFSGFQGQQSQYVGTTTYAYSYGSGITLQEQPVYYSGQLLTGGDNFISTAYIGSTIPKISGDLLGISGYQAGTLIVTGIAFGNTNINIYNLFGELTSRKIGQPIDTATGIQILSGLALVKIITQLQGPNYFATHFQKEATIDITPPTIVELINPLSGSIIPNTTVTLIRSAAIDTGSGLSGYLYLLSTTSGFTNIVLSGFTTNTGIIINNLNMHQTYYRKILAYDIAGNFSTSEIRNFTIDTPLDCLSGRDNDNFIDETFRAMNPNNSQIICALYGSGAGDQTAYTSYWTGYDQTSCLDDGIVVQHIAPGINPLPNTTGKLAPNTIYVLSSGAYIHSGSIHMNKCTALVGTTGTSIFYSTEVLDHSYTGNMIDNYHPGNNFMSGVQYLIIDHIFIDGKNNGLGGNHTGNNRGIRYQNNKNTTIYNTNITGNNQAILTTNNNYNNIINNAIYNEINLLSTDFTNIQKNIIENGGIDANIIRNITIIENTITKNQQGIYINSGEYITIENNTIKNNGAGIWLNTITKSNIIKNHAYNNQNEGIKLIQSNNIFLNNNHIYNNQYGIQTSYSSKISINNTQVYNNTYGIYLETNTTETLLNNIQAYNNEFYGIYANPVSSNYTIINNIEVYNNKQFGRTLSSTGYYHGNNQCFNNGGGCNLGLQQGGTTTRGRTTGNFINQGSISRNKISNPRNISGIYMIDRQTPLSNYSGGKVLSYTGSTTTTISYGSEILEQIQPVMRSGNEIIPYENYLSGTYIGSIDTAKLSGNVEIAGTTITGIAYTGIVTHYNLYGDIVNPVFGQPINTMTSVQYLTSVELNTIITQLRGANYFATHFQKTTYGIPPIIIFTGTTPATNSTVYQNNFQPEIEILSTPYLDNFIYYFNSTPYNYYNSGLLLMMNFDRIFDLGENNTIIKDLSIYNNTGTAYNGPTRTGNGGRRNGAYIFNGINSYIRTNNTLSTTSGITLQARIKFTNTGGNATITRIGNQSASEGYHRWYTNIGNKINWQYANGNARVTQQTPYLFKTGERYYLTITHNYLTKTINFYVNGYLINTINHTDPVLSITNKKVTIGIYDTGNGGFSGIIDEIRIRNYVLDDNTIHQMRRSNLIKYGTGSRRFTDDRQCMLDQTYTYTGYVRTNGGMTDSTGRITTISLTGYVPYAPTGFFVGSTGVSNVIANLYGQFTGYFMLEDRKGTTGRYTTIQLPLVFSGMNMPTNYFLNNGNNIRFMATGIDTLVGTNNGAVYLRTGIQNFMGSTGAFHYLKRVEQRTGYYCPFGIYANKPYISIDIPARQNPDIYKGIITIDFNLP